MDDKRKKRKAKPRGKAPRLKAPKPSMTANRIVAISGRGKGGAAIPGLGQKAQGTAIAADNIAEYADLATLQADTTGHRDYGFYEGGGIVHNYVWNRDTNDWRSADTPPRYIANTFAPAVDGSVNPPVVDTNGDPIRPGGVVEVTSSGTWVGMDFNAGDTLDAIVLSPSATAYAGNWSSNRTPRDLAKGAPNEISDLVPSTQERVWAGEDIQQAIRDMQIAARYRMKNPAFDYTALNVPERVTVALVNTQQAGVGLTWNRGGDTSEFYIQGEQVVGNPTGVVTVPGGSITLVQRIGTVVTMDVFEKNAFRRATTIANAAVRNYYFNEILFIEETGKLWARIGGTNVATFTNTNDANWLLLNPDPDVSTDLDFTVDPTFLTDRATIDAYVSALRGLQVGSSATFAGLPATRADTSPLQSASPPDVAWLTADDGANVKGLYFWDGTDWQLSLTFEDPTLLSRTEAEDPDSTVAGTTSGERMRQAIDARLEVLFPGDNVAPTINFENDYWLDETVGALPAPVLGKELAIGIVQANTTDAQGVKSAAMVRVTHYRGVDKGAGVEWAETVGSVAETVRTLQLSANDAIFADTTFSIDYTLYEENLFDTEVYSIGSDITFGVPTFPTGADDRPIRHRVFIGANTAEINVDFTAGGWKGLGAQADATGFTIPTGENRTLEFTKSEADNRGFVRVLGAASSGGETGPAVERETYIRNRGSVMVFGDLQFRVPSSGAAQMQMRVGSGTFPVIDFETTWSSQQGGASEQGQNFTIGTGWRYFRTNGMSFTQHNNYQTGSFVCNGWLYKAQLIVGLSWQNNNFSFTRWRLDAVQPVVNIDDVGVDDQGASGYRDIGTVRECWGLAAASAGFATVTFPAPFADNQYVLTGEPRGESTNNQETFEQRNHTASSFQGAVKYQSSTSSALFNDGRVYQWRAIGLKP